MMAFTMFNFIKKNSWHLVFDASKRWCNLVYNVYIPDEVVTKNNIVSYLLPNTTKKNSCRFSAIQKHKLGKCLIDYKINYCNLNFNKGYEYFLEILRKYFRAMQKNIIIIPEKLILNRKLFLVYCVRHGAIFVYLTHNRIIYLMRSGNKEYLCFLIDL